MAAATPDSGRRGLLFGRSAAVAPLRPPWTLDEPAFLDACTGCGACVERCPERVLATGAGRHPVFDPRAGECTFCGACAAGCPTGAIDRSRHAWSLRAMAGEACLPRRGVVCSSCRDACPEQAIRFPLATSLPVPDVDPARCTGCGACVAPCPVQAMGLARISEESA